MVKSDFNLLVVDDNTDNLKLVSSFLLNEGYKVTIATGGDDAIQIVIKERIDLILLDIVMPEGLDGFEVCRRLKKDSKTKEIPIIFLTAKNDSDDIVTGFQLGGVDYVPKPFRKEELLARVLNQVQIKMYKDLVNGRITYLEASRSEVMNWVYNLSKTLGNEK
jgi:two-component system, sensor histidine kinase and response regulator